MKKDYILPKIELLIVNTKNSIANDLSKINVNDTNYDNNEERFTEEFF